MKLSDTMGFRQQPMWIAAVIILMMIQGFLTLRLFGSTGSLEPLFDDKPILSGRHALHQYHGQLGALCWLERGTGSCIDPAFQAGYPKTPVFDAGSRPAELAMYLGSGQPSAYKLMVFCGCVMLPGCYLLAARGLGMSAGQGFLTALLGIAVSMSEPFQERLFAGEIDLFVGGALVLAHLAWMTRYDRHQSPGSWLMMTLLGTFAWFTLPLLSLALVPLLLLYYLWVACRHGLAWSMAFFGSTVVICLLNLVWMYDWCRYSWIFIPGSGPTGDWINPRMLSQVLEGLVPHDPIAYSIGLIGIIGTIGLFREQCEAVVLGWLAIGVTILTATVGRNWPPLGDLGADHFPSLAFVGAVCPAAWLLDRGRRRIGDSFGWQPIGVLGLIIVMAGAAWTIDLPQRLLNPTPLQLGLSDRQSQIVKYLATKTPPEGRILWEESPGNLGWTALLPMLTKRDYLGGLDHHAPIEHMHARLIDGKLAGVPMGLWSPVKLKQFLRRYNLHVIVCSSAESVSTFRRLSGWREVARLTDQIEASVFRDDMVPNLFLKGKGRVIQLDWQRIALAEVEPEDGEVVLSLHFQNGWRISPGFVTMERDLDGDDPIAMMRLKLGGPVARLTLIWENH